MVSDVVDQSGFEVLHRMLAALFIYLLFFLVAFFLLSPFEFYYYYFPKLGEVLLLKVACNL